MLMVGGDPEAFLFSPSGRPIPAHSLGIPVQKDAWTFPEGKIFRDGYAVEFNPNPVPCQNFPILQRNFRALLTRLLQELPAGTKVAGVPWIRINLQKDIWEGPEDVRVFGCTPSHDAYKDGEMSVPPVSATSFSFRSAGGHIHLTADSGPLANPDNYPMLARMFDHYAGALATKLLEVGERRPFERRSLYGRAGEYRPQVHGGWVGLEYRTLGPEVWFSSSFSEILANLEGVIANFDNLRRAPFRWEKSGARAYINGGEAEAEPAWLESHAKRKKETFSAVA